LRGKDLNLRPLGYEFDLCFAFVHAVPYISMTYFILVAPGSCCFGLLFLGSGSRFGSTCWRPVRRHPSAFRCFVFRQAPAIWRRRTSPSSSRRESLPVDVRGQRFSEFLRCRWGCCSPSPRIGPRKTATTAPRTPQSGPMLKRGWYIWRARNRRIWDTRPKFGVGKLWHNMSARMPWRPVFLRCPGRPRRRCIESWRNSHSIRKRSNITWSGAIQILKRECVRSRSFIRMWRYRMQDGRLARRLPTSLLFRWTRSLEAGHWQYRT
jgi:hypothetical protein